MYMKKNDHFSALNDFINNLKISEISSERKEILEPIINYIVNKATDSQIVNLNFICTHNSRRSHLSQIWAQVMAAHFGIQGVHCYSGGTEATALFPMVAETLRNSGMQIHQITNGINPVYAIKFSENSSPIIGFSKRSDDDFNPKSHFAAVMTCSHADENCPVILGAEHRIPIMYEDPKNSDNTPQQSKVYAQRSRQIATEMLYVFSKIK
jgi:arsenate reductase